MKWFKNMLSDEDGQGMVEYGILIAAIAIVVGAVIWLLGPKIAALFSSVESQLTTPAP